MAQANKQDTTMSSNPSPGIARRGFIAGAAWLIPAVAIAPTAFAGLVRCRCDLCCDHAYMKGARCVQFAATSMFSRARTSGSRRSLPKDRQQRKSAFRLPGPVFSRTHKEIDQYTPVRSVPHGKCERACRAVGS